MKIDLTKFIARRTFTNSNVLYNGGTGKPEYDTTDHVWLPSYDETENVSFDQLIVTATDFAIANGVVICDDMMGNDGKIGTAPYWLRSASSYDEAYHIDHYGDSKPINITDTHVGVRPALWLDLPPIISNERALCELKNKITTVKDIGGEFYHTIELGKYPNRKATNNDELENCRKSGKTDELKMTGGIYVGHLVGENSFTIYEEYEYKGEKYVCIKLNEHTNNARYKNDSKVKGNLSYEWFKVDPIVWLIKNWSDLPKCINPNGNNKTRFLDIQTAEVVIGGVPFYPNNYDKNGFFWQNSSIRGFLNGIDVRNIQTNGNIDYPAPYGGDFTGIGFLQQAFRQELKPILSKDKMENRLVKQMITRYEEQCAQLDKECEQKKQKLHNKLLEEIENLNLS